MNRSRRKKIVLIHIKLRFRHTISADHISSLALVSLFIFHCFPLFSILIIISAAVLSLIRHLIAAATHFCPTLSVNLFFFPPKTSCCVLCIIHVMGIASLLCYISLHHKTLHVIANISSTARVKEDKKYTLPFLPYYFDLASSRISDCFDPIKIRSNKSFDTCYTMRLSL